MKSMNDHSILEIRSLSDAAYILRFARKGIEFIPGQNILVGLPGDEDRPYSIYSGVTDDFIEILVKEVETGNISRKLKRLALGSTVLVSSPVGHFEIEAETALKQQFVFIATGTGIAPFHCFVRSFPQLKYKIIHGVRFRKDAYEATGYPLENYKLCTSGDVSGDFKGRVTGYLKLTELNPESYYYVCGSYDMIDEVYTLLIERNVPKKHIKTEGYF